MECTINGIGERAGNAALEEIVMALKVRRDIMPFTTGINTKLLSRASKLVSNVTGFPVQYNKAIVGKNAFAHESGIHQDGMLKNVETYEIMRPEDVGVKETSLVLGKLSGRHAFRDKLESLGYVMDGAGFEEAFRRFKELADKKKHVFDEDHRGPGGRRRSCAARTASPSRRLKVETGIGIEPAADLTLLHRGRGQARTTVGDGAGRRHLQGHPRALSAHGVVAAVPGQRRDRRAPMRRRRSACGLRKTGAPSRARAADTDTLVAAAYAYVNALNKLLVKREKQAPEALSVAR